MQQVKNYLKTLESYIKSEKDIMAALEKQTDVYTRDYIDQMKKQSHERIQVKQREVRKLINERVDQKVQMKKEQGIVNGLNSPEYQSQVSNILMKVQMAGKGISKRMLNEMLQPVIDKEDFVTIDAIRGYVSALDAPDRDSILSSIPRITDKVAILEDTRTIINKAIDSNDYEVGGLKASLNDSYLEQSGVFEI